MVNDGSWLSVMSAMRLKRLPLPRTPHTPCRPGQTSRRPHGNPTYAHLPPFPDRSPPGGQHPLLSHRPGIICVRLYHTMAVLHGCGDAVTALPRAATVLSRHSYETSPPDRLSPSTVWASRGRSRARRFPASTLAVQRPGAPGAGSLTAASARLDSGPDGVRPGRPLLPLVPPAGDGNSRTYTWQPGRPVDTCAVLEYNPR
jgi:hypothetical protein